MIRGEPGCTETIIRSHNNFLDSECRATVVGVIENVVLDLSIRHIDGHIREALEGSELKWEASNHELRGGDPYCHVNFTYSLSRVSMYIL